MNHWDEWVLPGPSDPVMLAPLPSGRKLEEMRQIARALNLPLRVVLYSPPVPAKPAHRRRYSR